MTAIKDSTVTDTVKYNGVTFGGANVFGSTNMYEPRVTLSGKMVYDDANRSVIGVQYTLTVQTVVFGSDEAETTAVIKSLRDRLSTPGKTLELDGLGLGFATDPTDITWGPKPITFDTRSVGSNIAIELIWSIEFTVNHCASTSGNPNQWMAFNYTTDWGYDFEGQGTRTISGYIQVAQTRKGDVAKHVADAVRDRLNVVVPVGFRRDSFTFNENASKDRISFSIRDVQLDAEAFPVDITEASGTSSVSAQGIAGVTGNAVLTMAVTTAPGVPRNRAGQVFFPAAMKKQLELNRDIRGRDGKGQALPVSMTLSHELWTRRSNFQMVWALTGCAFDALAKGGVWVPVADGNYDRWKASMDRLWVNRGTTDLGTVASEDIIVNLCVSTNDATIGKRGTIPGAVQKLSWRYSCPEVPEDASWLFYDFRLRVLRQDHRTLHRKAKEFIPAVITATPDTHGDPKSSGCYVGSSWRGIHHPGRRQT